MPLVSFDDAAGTFVHRCGLCGYLDTLSIDPAHGDITLGASRDTFATRACPHCAFHKASVAPAGEPVLVVEAFALNPTSWEAGEAPHPGSLVGTTFPDTGGIVTEHTIGYHLNAFAVHQRTLIRAMQRHRLLAPHAPLAPDPPAVRGHVERWDGTWRPPTADTPPTPKA